MVEFLKSLRRNGSASDSRIEEIETMVKRVEQQRGALETLVTRAEGAGEDLKRLSAPITQSARAVSSLVDRVEGLEKQLSALDGVRPLIATTQEEADRLAKSQKRTEAQLAHSAEDAERIQSQMAALSDKLDAAFALKDELSSFLNVEGPLKELRAEADSISGQVREVGDGLGRVREQQAEVMGAQKQATSRLEAFEAASQASFRSIEEAQARIGTMEGALSGLTQTAESAAGAKHQIGVLKALADQVTQKVAGLEQQREMVDRVAGQASNLTEQMRQVDAALRKQEDSAQSLSAMQQKLADAREPQTAVLARSDEVAARQREIDEHERAARGRLAELRKELDRSVERFDLENRALESVNQLVLDLRSTLADCERRFGSMSASSQIAEELESRAQSLSSQVSAVAQDVSRLEEDAARVRAVRAEAERLEQTVDGIALRVGRIEESQPTIDAAVQNLSGLRRSDEAVRDGLEQVRLAYGEMTKLRESHAETEAWLANADVWARSLRDQVKELNGMKPTVDFVRREVERVNESMSAIESRRELVDDVQDRMAQLATQNGEFDARCDALKIRIEGAEGGLASLTTQAEEAERISRQIATVASSADGAEGRIGEISTEIATLESRSKNLETLAERTRQLGQELEQRQGALEQASAHLKQASGLRQEAADAAHRLEEQSRRLSTALTGAEERANRLDGLSRELEDRGSSLRFVEQRMTQFEEQLAQWETAEAEVGQALEQVLARRSAIDALQSEIKQLFDMAERTVEDVRSITAAKEDIEDARTLLGSTQDRLREAQEAARAIEGRKQQVDSAEKRLARVEALHIDVRSSLETLQGQKALVDHVVEKAGTLSYQAKQAEALIDMLREERTIATRVRAAVEDPEQEDVAESPVSGD